MAIDSSAAAAPSSSLFGLQVDALTREQAVERCLEAVRTGSPLEVGVVNAAKVVRMRENPDLARSVSGCGLILADGQSVVWASKLLGQPLPERVAGIDLFEDLLGAAERHGMSVYLLGAKPEVIEAAVANARTRWPELRIAGYRDGYFTDEQQGEVADAIRESGAQLLFLGMTSPKKEIFCAEYGRRTGASLVHGVGGSIDILSGLTRRAPAAWQKIGMEWAYRTVQEPGRMLPRYLRTNTAFVALVAREWARGRVGRRRAGSSA
jgi:N-acetylglucosaminyldiphosphoundecaprenol N-acetyl-beta-D-mannosaminyltransferase